MSPKMVEVTSDKLDKYFAITGEALEKASASEKDKSHEGWVEDFLDMASRYYSDAKFFRDSGDYINAFAALNYAHGWLDSGARIGLFKVRDSRLFTVDD